MNSIFKIISNKKNNNKNNRDQIWQMKKIERVWNLKKQIVIKRTWTKFKEKTNWRVALKIWMVRHESRVEEIKEGKQNVVGAKPKVSKPHSLSSDKKISLRWFKSVSKVTI